MKENGKMIRLMVMVLTLMLMVQNTLVIGLMISKKDTALKFGMMVLNTMVNMCKVKLKFQLKKAKLLSLITKISKREINLGI